MLVQISVISCSRSGNLKRFKENLRNTIGVEHEIIIIDNSEGKYSLFQAYNQGIEKSKGEILCFIHDDVVLHTENWGKILMKLFSKHKEVGLIGIAGSKLKTKMPSAWWDCPQPYRAANIIQHLDEETKEHWNYSFKQNEEEVVSIDGVFMAARKDDTIGFNKNLKGFHNYDLSFSIDYLKKGYKIITTNQILIEHFSMGTLDSSWYRSSIELYNQYKGDLPLSTAQVPGDAVFRQEFSNGILFINGLIQKGMRKEAYAIWKKLFLKRPLWKKHISIFNSFIK